MENHQPFLDFSGRQLWRDLLVKKYDNPDDSSVPPSLVTSGTSTPEESEDSGDESEDEPSTDTDWVGLASMASGRRRQASAAAASSEASAKTAAASPVKASAKTTPASPSEASAKTAETAAASPLKASAKTTPAPPSKASPKKKAASPLKASAKTAAASLTAAAFRYPLRAAAKTAAAAAALKASPKTAPPHVKAAPKTAAAPPWEASAETAAAGKRNRSDSESSDSELKVSPSVSLGRCLTASAEFLTDPADSAWTDLFMWAKILVRSVVSLRNGAMPELENSVFWNPPQPLLACTGYSGMGGAEVALHCIGHATGDLAWNEEEGPKFVADIESAQDFNQDCQKLLKALLPSNACVYGDYLDWLPKDVKRAVEEAEKVEDEPWETWKQLIFGCDLLEKGKCTKHPFKVCPRPQNYHLLVAGSVCKDWSVMNQSRKGRNGPFGKIFLAFVGTLLF